MSEMLCTLYSRGHKLLSYFEKEFPCLERDARDPFNACLVLHEFMQHEHGCNPFNGGP